MWHCGPILSQMMLVYPDDTPMENDIFNKDILMIAIQSVNHNSLVVVFHPDKMARGERGTIIVHLDSLPGHHNDSCMKVQNWLYVQCKRSRNAQITLEEVKDLTHIHVPRLHRVRHLTFWRLVFMHELFIYLEGTRPCMP